MTIGLKRISIGNTEFIGFQAGGDIRVGFSIDIGVDAQGNRSDFTQTRGNFLNTVDFGNAFHIEAFHACIQCKLDFCFTFAHTGKNRFRRIAACRQNTRQLTAGYNVKTAPPRSKVLDDAQVAIRFHCVADKRIQSGKCGLVVFKCLGQRRFAVHIKRRTKLFGKMCIRELFAE